MATEALRGDPDVTPFHAHWNRRIDALAMGTLRDDVFIAEVLRLGNHARESPWAVIAIMDRRVKLGQLAAGLVREVELRVAQREFGSQEAEPPADPSPQFPRYVHEPTVELPLQPARYGHEPAVEPPVRSPETPRRVATQRIRRISQAEMASSTLVDAQSTAPARDVPVVNELALDSVLAERYVIRSLLGDGGMGRVYKALDRQRREQFALEAHVAVKVLRERTQDPQALARLRAEFDALNALDHHNIVRVYDLGRDGPLDFFTMEFLVGELLSKFMTRFRGEPLPRDEAWGIIRDLGAALEHAHAAGVVHGDLTPRNVMMLRNGDIKLMDFGASAGGDIGQVTPGYASLELLVGMPPEARDDLFALACIGYELLDGRHPFAHRSAGEARDAGMVPPPPPGLTETQWQWLQSALAFERSGRPASAGDLLVGLGLQAVPAALSSRVAALPRTASPPAPRATLPDEAGGALEKTGVLPPLGVPPARAPASPPQAPPLSIEEQFVLDSVREAAAAAARPEPRTPAPSRQSTPAAEPARTRVTQDVPPAALEKTAALPPLVIPPKEPPPPPAATAPVMASWLATAPPDKTLPLSESRPVPAPRPPAATAPVMASWLATAPPDKTLPLSESRPVPAPPPRPAQTGAVPSEPVSESLEVIAPWLATAPPNKTLPLSDERTWPATPSPPPAGLEHTAVLPSLIVPPAPMPTAAPPAATASRQSVSNTPLVMEPWLANAPPSKTLPLFESRPAAPEPQSPLPAALEHTAELPLLVIPPSSLPAPAPGAERPSARVSWGITPADGVPPSPAESRLSPAPLVPLVIPLPAKAAPLVVETWQGSDEESAAEAASWQAAAAGTELPGVVESWQSPGPATATPAGADAWQSAVPGRESLMVESWQPPTLPKRPSFAVDDWQPHKTRTRLLACTGVLLLAAGVWFWQAQTPDDGGEAVPVTAPSTPEVAPPASSAPVPIPAPAARGPAAAKPAAAKPAARPAPRPVVAPGGTVSIAPVTIKAGTAARYAEIKVTRTESSRPLTFTWWTEDGTARAGSDYLAKAKSTAYIAAGARSATLFVKIAGNSTRKQPVRFTVRIARPSAGVLGDAAASVTLAAR